jgi:hypothetical protein
LAFDGKDDLATSARPVLDPAKGPFSALVWIKGGSPGQTVLSQAGGADWLMAGATGALATELSKGGRIVNRLSSQSVVDVGAGAGFPGLPLKIARPEISLTLIDSVKKKTDFLNHIVSKLGLDKVRVICGRAEDLAKDMRERGPAENK